MFFLENEEELKELLCKNPKLKINKASFSSVDIDQNSNKHNKHSVNKHRNVKVYVFNDAPYVKTENEYNHMYATLPSIQFNRKPDVTFDSIKEYNRYEELRLLAQEGLISDLKRQCKLVILPSFERAGEHVRAINYRPDFMYQENDNIIVEDVKAFDKKTGEYLTTEVFNIKWKLLKHKYPEYIFRLY